MCYQAMTVETLVRSANFENHEGDSLEFVLEEQMVGMVMMKSDRNGVLRGEDSEGGETFDQAEGEEGEVSEGEVVVLENVEEVVEEAEAEDTTFTDQAADSNEGNVSNAGSEEDEDDGEDDGDDENRTLKQKWWDYLVT